MGLYPWSTKYTLQYCQLRHIYRHFYCCIDNSGDNGFWIELFWVSSIPWSGFQNILMRICGIIWWVGRNVNNFKWINDHSHIIRVIMRMRKASGARSMFPERMFPTTVAEASWSSAAEVGAKSIMTMRAITQRILWFMIVLNKFWWCE